MATAASKQFLAAVPCHRMAATTTGNKNKHDSDTIGTRNLAGSDNGDGHAGRALLGHNSLDILIEVLTFDSGWVE